MHRRRARSNVGYLVEYADGRLDRLMTYRSSVDRHIAQGIVRVVWRTVRNEAGRLSIIGRYH